MKVKELNKSMVGKKISCVIDRVKVDDAKVQLENGTYYICQNLRNGDACHNKLGYRYSWVVDNGSATALCANKVTNVVLLPRKADLSDGVLEGDILYSPEYGYKLEVLGIVGKAILAATSSGSYVYTLEQLQKRGYMLQVEKEEEEVVEELTMEEVCKALGKTIKIKK